jgi:hypothetical protein
MTLREAGAVAAVLAALGQYAVVAPLRARTAALVEAHRVAREERRAARARLRDAEARAEVARQAAALVRAAGPGGDEAAREVRRAVVEALGGVRDVRLGVRPDRAGVRVELSARASAAEAAALLGRLARPEVGVVLEDVKLSRGPDGVDVRVDGVAFRGAS